MKHSMATETCEAITWRDNWIVKNWLTALPFAGGFFKTEDLKEAANYFLHYTFMLAGGTTLMLIEILPTSMEDSAIVKHTKMTANMAIGMTAGEIACNMLFSVSKSAINCCCREEYTPKYEANQYQSLA